MKRNIIKAAFISLFMFASNAMAQINPFDAMFFGNGYIANPAMAGFSEGARLNVGYRNQWSNVPGSPRMQHIMYDVQSNRIGFGARVYNNREGDINQTRVSGAMAFHLPISDYGRQIHFGLNVGAQAGSYDMQGLVGNVNDPSVIAFNDRGTQFDGDFGMAYTSERLSMEFAVYNVLDQISKDDNNIADFNTFYSAVGYKFPMENWKLNTKIAYRGVRNYTNIVDMGMEFKTNNDKLGFTGIYHTNKSATFGLSYLHQEKWEITGFYNTTANPISNAANGVFEVALQIHLSKARLKL